MTRAIAGSTSRTIGGASGPRPEALHESETGQRRDMPRIRIGHDGDLGPLPRRGVEGAKRDHLLPRHHRGERLDPGGFLRRVHPAGEDERRFRHADASDL
jgi:hypothetical protein